jgi:ubiquinone/menaquinone biosynthesis C-methylase UbiE
VVEMKQKEDWESLYEKKGRYGTEHCSFAIKALKWMKKIKGSKILDLGCGECKDSIFFAKNCYEVFCLDFSEKAIKSGKENVIKSNVQKLVHPILYDISKPLKFEDETFDGVFAHLSLHYFDDKTTTKIFNEIRRVLKVGGILFVKVKSTKDPLYGKGKKIGNDMFELGHVRHFFSKEYLINKTKGFKILSIKQIKEETDYAVKEISKESVFLELIGQKVD